MILVKNIPILPPGIKETTRTIGSEISGRKVAYRQKTNENVRPSIPTDSSVRLELKKKKKNSVL